MGAGAGAGAGGGGAAVLGAVGGGARRAEWKQVKLAK
jgi:hypothetical protein